MSPAKSLCWRLSVLYESIRRSLQSGMNGFRLLLLVFVTEMTYIIMHETSKTATASPVSALPLTAKGHIS